MSELSLRGRCALVTGSTAGLGMAIAAHLAKAGARIVLHALRDDDTARQARDSLARQGADVLFYAADPNDVDQIEAMAADAHRAGDGVDIVVHNAVVRHFRPAHALPRRDWDQALASELSA